jgi:hypothetical protein
VIGARNRPIRKPLAVLAFFFICLMTLICVRTQGDVPDGTKTILIAMLAIPVTVIGSSSYEAKNCPPRSPADGVKPTPEDWRPEDDPGNGG